MNEEVDRLFNPFYRMGTSSLQIGAGSLYLMGYEISDSGYIELPIIKNIYIEGLTIKEAREKIQQSAEKYLNEPHVIVKLSTFKFTILGEVKSPGAKEHGVHQINLLEALVLGGDITYNGNRQNILILRATKDGTKAFRVDVTNKNLVSSEAYYIQPNDIIYVEPLKTTLFREVSSDYLFLLSTITSAVTALLLILNIVL
ncbi:unnamed protein product [marine sediment metagenome]|uniref:Polysaccharide export protein N-terminal domain-containing protein n=1 Tax=marine sediment metagenome TaxID=412755 RepID=X1MCA4_9ZZZZ